MSNHIENERRVDGEFHYAVLVEQISTGDYYEIRRKTDGIQPPMHGGRFGGSPNCEDFIREKLEALDANTRHWIEHTQAQNQRLGEAINATLITERGRAELNRRKDPAADEKHSYCADAMERLLDLSNNPQVSEGSEAEVVREALSPVTFRWDRKEITVPIGGSYSGAELRKAALANGVSAPSDRDLFEVVPGAPDRLIGDHDCVIVNAGTRLFTIPRMINAGANSEGEEGSEAAGEINWANDRVVTIGSRHNEIVVHRPSEGDVWTCDECGKTDPTVWKFDRWRPLPQVQTTRCPNCLFAALAGPEAAGQTKTVGVSQPDQAKQPGVSRHDSDTDPPTTKQLVELIEAAAEANVYIENVEASEENTRVGGRLYQALRSITGPDRQKFIDWLRGGCRNVSPSTPESAAAIQTVMNAAKDRLSEQSEGGEG